MPLMGGTYKEPRTIVEYELVRGSNFYTKLPLLSENPWDTLTPEGWNWNMRAGEKEPTIIKDYTAPISPDNVLRIPFKGAGPDSEPCVIWFSLPSCTRLYWEYWVKLSSDWKPSPAGFCKLTFAYPPSGGDMYMAAYGNEAPYGSASCHEYGAIKTGGQLQWGGAGGTAFFSNTGREVLTQRGTWMHHAGYLDLVKRIWRWWLNDTLVGNYSDIATPDQKLIEWQIAMTVQEKCNVEEQHALFDHVILRGDLEGFTKGKKDANKKLEQDR